MSNGKRGDANRHALKDRKDDLYETPPEATRALLNAMKLPQCIWCPECGPGAMVAVLRASGRFCVASDLVDYGCPDSESGVDFLMELSAPRGCDIIVMNPPYKLSDQFVRHGLRLCSRVVMLNRLAYLEGAKRSDIIDGHLSQVFVGIERLPMMHRDGWEGPKVKSGAMQFAWFVFDRVRPQATTLQRISWRG